MNNLPGTSADILADNITKIKQLFPEVFTEDKIDFERLQEVLGDYIEDKEERYRFEWNGKSKALRLSQIQSTGTLRPSKKYPDGEDDSKDWDTTENMYIEGDNLEVLKLLQKTYHNRIKMIYIDPPYNTGGDFVYKDDFKDNIKNYLEITGQTDEEGKKLSTNSETSGRYHTDWLNMMYPRLRLARNLLTDDGVIFISIDDNEVGNLRNICNEIFGEENFVGALSVENNPKGRKNSAFISVSSEYCVIYAKSKKEARFIENVPKKASDMIKDEDGKYVHGSGKRVLVGENKFNKYVVKTDTDKNYSVYFRYKDRSLILKKEEYGITDQQLLSNDYIKYYSNNNEKLVENTYTESKFQELFDKRSLEFSSNKVYEKNFSDTIRIKSQLVNRKYEAIVRGEKQFYSMELTTTGAGTYIKNLFEVGESPFQAPKNVGYLKLLISLLENEEFIVLDFFSGSATSADAVMQINAEDGGNRKFIMVQLPGQTDEKSEAYKAGYKNICEIGKERIRRAGDKIKEGLQGQQFKISEEPKEVPDIGFKVFKLDSSNLKKWNPDHDDLENSILNMVSNYVDGRTEEDVLYEIMLKYGIDLTYSIETATVDGKQVFNIGFGSLFVCLAEDIDMNIAKHITQKRDELMPDDEDHRAQRNAVRVVFKDNGFVDDSTKTNVEMELERCGFEEVVSV